MLLNQVLYINKDVGMTSYDVCHRIKKKFRTKQVGHTGTLDPNASGVMIVLLNNACKLNQFLVKQTKTYQGEVKIGFRTDTLDIDGKVIETNEQRIINIADFVEQAKTFIGKMMQVPPMTSAVKINGKKLMEYKRLNQEVDVPAREIEIFDFQITAVTPDSFSFVADVSSGTYIRVLIEDYLKHFSLIGTLVKLHRTRVGNIEIDSCFHLEDVENDSYKGVDSYHIMTAYYHTIEVDEPYKIMQGKLFNYECEHENILLVHQGRLLAVYKRVDYGVYRCVRGLF